MGKVANRRFDEIRKDLNQNEQSFSVSYRFEAIDFGAGDSTEVIAPPAGKVGVVVGVTLVNVTEAFTTDTTPARVDVGTSGDADEYAISGGFGTTGVGASVSPALTDGVSANLLPPDTDVQLTFVAPTGGVPAGVADCIVTIVYQ